MNIFYLSKNWQRAAEMHCDKHVCKMLIEYAQMLSTAHRILDEDNVVSEDLYKIAHKNHPCTIWVRENELHYTWLFLMFESLSKEYTKRYGKTHASWSKLHTHLSLPPKNITQKKWTDPPQCMPDHCKDDDVVRAYRNYYILEKNNFAVWKYSGTPKWYTKGMSHANV